MHHGDVLGKHLAEGIGLPGIPPIGHAERQVESLHVGRCMVGLHTLARLGQHLAVPFAENPPRRGAVGLQLVGGSVRRVL